MKAKQRRFVPWALAPLALLAACQSGPSEPRRAQAPLPAEIAQRLEGVRAERTEYPDFADVPPPPANVRTAEQWRQFVLATEGQGTALHRWAVANPPWNTDMAGYVARARAELAPAGEAPPPDQQARTEAWAQRMRQLVVPPPAPQ